MNLWCVCSHSQLYSQALPPLKLERGKPGMFQGMKYIPYRELALNWWVSEFAIVLSGLLPLIWCGRSIIKLSVWTQLTTCLCSIRSTLPSLSNWKGESLVCMFLHMNYVPYRELALNWWARLVNSPMIVLLTVLSRFGVGNRSSNWVWEHN